MLIHPKMASLMMDVDDVAGKCGVAVDVISAYDSGWSGRKYAENGRAVRARLFVSYYQSSFVCFFCLEQNGVAS